MRRLLPGLRLVVAVAALLAAVLLAGWFSQRHVYQVRLAAAGELELSDASRRLLERFEGPVQLTAFLDEDAALRDHVARLLAAYREARPDLRFDLVDPQARPELVRELAVTRRGEVVVSYRGRRERAMAPTQARISAALERLLFEADPYVAFVTGHGERDMLGLANFDLGQFGRQLQRKGYRIQPWRLDGGQPVPDNTNLLVVAGPETPFTTAEAGALTDYLDRGGALLWLTEPAASADIPVLGEYLGIRRQPGVVVDPTAGELLALDDPRLLLLDGQHQHQLVTIPDAPVLLPRAAALHADAAGDWRRIDLLRAGEQARLAPLPWEPGSEGAAPAAGAALGVGFARDAAATAGTREQRIAVVGDGDFLSNSYLGNGGNLPFGLNLVQWLLASDTLMDTYQPATPDQRLAFSRTGQAVLGLGFLLGLPLLLAGAGAWRWWRLRRG